MKKIIILLLSIFSTSILCFAQDIEVINNIDVEYTIRAVYEYNGSTDQVDFLLPNLGTETIPEIDPNNSNYTLHHWKIFSNSCTPTLSAEHVYGTSDTDPITHCKKCQDGAVSDYNSTTFTNIVGCR